MLCQGDSDAWNLWDAWGLVPAPLHYGVHASLHHGVQAGETGMPGYGCLVDSVDDEREETTVVWHLSRDDTRIKPNHLYRSASD